MGGWTLTTRPQAYKCNPAAYTSAAGNQYGDVGRNSIRQPYFMRGDITLSKLFPITESKSFEYRLEIFNVFSLWHSNINGGANGGGGIQGNQHAPNFGSLVGYNSSSAGTLLPESEQSGLRQLWNPRIIQMTAKFTFLTRKALPPSHASRMLLVDIRLLDGASFEGDVILGICAWPVSSPQADS